MDVLLVDDHPLIHETLRAIVRSVRPAAYFHSRFDLATALQEAGRLESLGPVLLDPELPDCTGMQALSRFRERFPDAALGAAESAFESADWAGGAAVSVGGACGKGRKRVQ